MTTDFPDVTDWLDMDARTNEHALEKPIHLRNLSGVWLIYMGENRDVRTRA